MNIDSIILEAEGEFQEILNYIVGDAQEQKIHEVERSLFVRLLQLGLTLLRVFLASKGDGNVGESHTDKEGVTGRQLFLSAARMGNFTGSQKSLQQSNRFFKKNSAN